MGGFDPSVCFELKEHSCQRTNDRVAQDRDALLNIAVSFSEPETEDLRVLTKRLDSALLALHATKLWQDYTPTDSVNREEAFEKMEPFFQGENSAPCPGLGSACFFYASAPMMAVRALAEEFEVPMRVKQRDADQQLCERAFGSH